jgi:hypothetical protein
MHHGRESKLFKIVTISERKIFQNAGAEICLGELGRDEMNMEPIYTDKSFEFVIPASW